MTIDQITEAIKPFKPSSRRQVIRYMNACGLEPIGARQRPQHYPKNSANRVLVHLGIVPPIQKRFVADKSAKVINGASVVKIPTMPQLRAERKKARAGK